MSPSSGHLVALAMFFFSRKRRRAALHYIKKRVKGKSPNNATTHTHKLTHTRTHTPPVSRVTLAPATKLLKATTTTKANLATREEGRQKRKPSSPSRGPQMAFLPSRHQGTNQIWSCSVENTPIAVVPNSPSSENNERINSLPCQLNSGAAAGLLPPIKEGKLSGLRGQVL